MKNGKLFGVVNIIDLAVILFIFVGLTGLILVKSGKFATSAHTIKKQAMIEFDVAIRGLKLSSDEQLFKVGDKTFITIRNVPYTSLDIVKSAMAPWQTVIPDPKNPSRAIAVKDPAETNTYNYTVTLRDKALITDDGAVIGGNKIKTGLLVTLEGFKYRVNGVVTDVRVNDNVEK
jgi:hypothetical protein